MHNHVWRPLFVALAVVLLILGIRVVYVPDDFGIHEQGYMYGWHRKGNEAEWKAMKVKYKTTAYCKECHQDKHADLMLSVHARIACENCHGPAFGHPEDPPFLTTDRSRELCVRCHLRLPYHTSGRGKIRGINPKTHYQQLECVYCHSPHNPKPWRQEEARQ